MLVPEGLVAQRELVAVRGAPVGRTPLPALGLLPSMQLRGGGKSKPARPRSWKEQSTHHAELRKSSIRKNRNKNAQEATYTKEARDNIRKVADARRLREMGENEQRKARLKEERATDFNHQMRLEYMRANEEGDKRREEKYQTLEDYSDSVERELEELRQSRGETRGLTVPDWREEHPIYWKEVSKETRDDQELDDPKKVVCVSHALSQSHPSRSVRVARSHSRTLTRALSRISKSLYPWIVRF